MFRSLATRLTAAYVFAAIVLVVIVLAAVTAFALSAFGFASREASAAVARQAPDAIRLQVARHGTLEAAAGDLARDLSRPGLHVVIFRVHREGRRFFLAASVGEGEDGRPVIVTAERMRFGEPGGPSPHFGPPPGFQLQLGPPPGPPPRFGPSSFDAQHRPSDVMAPFPFGLNLFLRLQPNIVESGGARVIILPDPTPLAHIINAFWLAMLPIGLFVIVAAWLLGRAITGQALRPLVETTTSLHRFGAGDFTPRTIESSQRNEIGALVNAYNAAAAQVSAAFEERRAAEAQMRQFVADAGHELRTPLTVVMGYIDVLRRRTQNEPSASLQIYDTMLAESRRMRALIDKLIVLARLEHPLGAQRELETVDLADVAARVALSLEARAAGTPIALHRACDALVRGDETELYDAVSNLAENALKYAPGSPVEIDVRTEANEVVLAVSDHGPGIKPAEQERIFDRFYRGRERADSEGFGLGLAIAKRAVERAGGILSLATAPGGGARFVMRIPAAS
jgi:two-component system OmpR family sensor kinase